MHLPPPPPFDSFLLPHSCGNGAVLYDKEAIDGGAGGAGPHRPSLVLKTKVLPWVSRSHAQLGQWETSHIKEATQLRDEHPLTARIEIEERHEPSLSIER